MGKTFTIVTRKGETIDQAEDRFFAEHPELLDKTDLTLLIVDLENDFVED